jgi:hypothetical protein
MSPARVSLALLMSLSLTVAARADDKPAAGKAVEFEKLKAALPETVAGQKRTSHDGHALQTGETSMSVATASYGEEEKENAPTIRLSLTDYGPGDNSPAKGMAAGWGATTMSSETGEGYTKTVKVDGQPGFESFHKGNKQGSLALAVNERFMLMIDVTNLPPEQMQKIAAELDLKKIAALAK